MAAADLARNQQARALWLSRGLRCVRPLPASTGQVGGTVRIKLDPTGLLVGLTIRATLRVNITGAVATPGNSSPYSLLSRVRLTDDEGRDRVNIGGDHLAMLQAIKARTGGLGQSGLIYSYPKVPVNIGTNQLVDVSFYVPVCADEWRDLRGAMWMPRWSQTYLFVDFAPSLFTLGDDAAVYKGAATTTVALNTSTQQPTIEVLQHFLDGDMPLPAADLALVHYLDGMKQITSGMGANTEQLIDYPVARAVSRFLFSHYVDNAMAVTNLAQIRSLKRSNVDLLRQSNVEEFIYQRRTLQGNDLPPGYWFIEHLPEVANAYAREYQAGITPAVSGASSQSMSYTFESYGVK